MSDVVYAGGAGQTPKSKGRSSRRNKRRNNKAKNSPAPVSPPLNADTNIRVQEVDLLGLDDTETPALSSLSTVSSASSPQVIPTKGLRESMYGNLDPLPPSSPPSPLPSSSPLDLLSSDPPPQPTTPFSPPPPTSPHTPHDHNSGPKNPQSHPWHMLFCFLGIMTSFLIYGLLLEYATSRNGTKLHELSFLFVTSALYTTCAYMCRNIMNEKPNTSIPPHEFAVLGLTSMGSTFCSVRSLRYVIYPIQILAKSCKPIPVMLFGVVLGERYPLKKFINVGFIVSGVALFMGGGSSASKAGSSGSFVGLILLFISLCFDGGTGAYEDKLMRKSHVGPFDLMFNIQLGKTILSGVGLIIFNQTNEFTNMVNELGVVLLGLGISGAAGQVFIFLTISYFGALTCSIIGLARKVTTLVASIYVYGHHINVIQGCGLGVCVGAMVVNFWGKGGKKEKKEEGQGEEEERGLLKEDEDVEEGEVEMNEVGGSQVGGGVQIENV